MDPNADNKLSPREKTELFYQILSGRARTKLLESVIDFSLPELIGLDGYMTLEDIISTLQLSPTRAKKWLYLLGTEGFLIERKLEARNTYTYSLGPVLKALFDDGDDWWFFKEQISSWRIIDNENMVSVLQGGEIYIDVNWPPKTTEEAVLLEKWMARSSKVFTKTINANMPLQHTKRILDVGGGDGTIACALAQMHPSLKFTVYNLPEAIKLAKQVIEEQRVSDRVDVLEGDFIKEDTFPKGYDIILLVRTLCVWPDDICAKIIKMAYEALNDRGYIIICEEFKDLNQDWMLAWEFRYMYWDSFYKAVYKPSDVYQKILQETGFNDIQLSEVNDDGICRVIKAMKGNQLAM